MRFEIGAAGVFLILAGLAGLSGSVFVLGMFAGYEVARQDQPNPGLALVYPVPTSAPASLSAPPVQSPASGLSAGATPAPVAAAGALPAPAVSSGPLPPVIAAPPQPETAPPPSAAAQKPGTARAERSPAAASPQAGSTPSTKLSAAKPAEKENPRPAVGVEHFGPYSVEIQAVMDGQAALQLVNKLREHGYQAYSVETQIEGRTWYKVRVGHFASRAEAQSAEERLHEQFSGSLTTR